MRLPTTAVLAVLALAVPAAAAPVELLHHVPSRVVVSSKIESKTIQPAQLVDGDRATAWNANRGDLVGAWVEVTVPADVTVDEIKLIVGHTGKGKEGDYFPMNHRIKKLRVLRDGKMLVDAELDPNNRELQSIPIAQPGGTYRLQVLATVAGSKKAWRELAIAELEVWGSVPAWRTPRRHDVSVDVAGETRSWWSDPPALVRAYGAPKSFDEVCKATNCTAGTMKKLSPKDSAFKTIAVEPGVGRGYSRFYLETAAGWWYAGATEIGAYSYGANTGVVEQLEVKDGFALITVDQRAPSGDDHARLFMVCTVTADNTPACLHHNIAVEVVSSKYDTRWQQKVTFANGILSIDRGDKPGAWEWQIGDYKLVP